MIQDVPNSGSNHVEDKEIFEISAKGAIVFIIVASVFLLLLFYFMSSWFVWVLIVLFCIGGIEVFSPLGSFFLWILNFLLSLTT
jgi:signal peptide peptidase-like 2B